MEGLSKASLQVYLDLLGKKGQERDNSYSKLATGAMKYTSTYLKAKLFPPPLNAFMLSNARERARQVKRIIY